MASNKRFKGSKYSEPFVGIVRSVFESQAFADLSPHACKLLLELVGQFRGDNNGDLTLAWSVVSKRGWRSRTTLWRCKQELIDAGFIYVTRIGQFPRTCELVALTWFPLDVSKKFDPGALDGFVPKAYMARNPLVQTEPKKKTDKPSETAATVPAKNALLCPPLEHCDTP